MFIPVKRDAWKPETRKGSPLSESFRNQEQYRQESDALESWRIVDNVPGNLTR